MDARVSSSTPNTLQDLAGETRLQNRKDFLRDLLQLDYDYAVVGEESFSQTMTFEGQDCAPHDVRSSSSQSWLTQNRS